MPACSIRYYATKSALNVPNTRAMAPERHFNHLVTACSVEISSPPRRPGSPVPLSPSPTSRCWLAHQKLRQRLSRLYRISLSNAPCVVLRYRCLGCFLLGCWGVDGRMVMSTPHQRRPALLPGTSVPAFHPTKYFICS